MDRNKTLEAKFMELLRSHKQYIYGAGIVGKRLYNIIKRLALEKQILGFVVSEKKENTPQYIDDKKVYLLSDITDKEANILIAVSDAYQNEILYLLRVREYKNIVCAYEYSLLDEKNIPFHIPEDIPEVIEMDIRELMSMQFINDTFLKYDILKELLEFNPNQEATNVQEQAVIVDKNMVICEGNYEICKAIVRKRERVQIKQQYQEEAAFYKRNWLEGKFEEQELQVLDKKLVEYRNYWKQPLVGIIWTPAFRYADRITDDIRQYADVIKSKDICIEKKRLMELIQDIYETDDVEPWQMEEKYKRMSLEKENWIRIVWFSFCHPQFRIKRFGHTISSAGVHMKNEIRNLYKKDIDNYLHDIILHTTDNYEQSEKVTKKLERYINA